MDAEGLDKKAVKGFFWLMLGVYLQPAADVFIKIVLVRLLLPIEFGFFATAYIVINLLKVLNEAGIAAAIIKKNDVDDESLSSAFFFIILLSFILLVSALIFAPLIANFFKNSSLVLIIRVLSMVVFIDSFFYVHNAILIKNLNFKDTVIPMWGGIIAYAVSGIVLAYLNFGTWSLVWSTLARSMVSVMLFWRVNSWRPRFCFNYSKLKTLLVFGIRVSAIRILWYVRNNIDYLVIAKLLGPVFLGYYYVAYQVAHFCNKKFSPALGKIVFPVFSQLDEDDKIQKYYFKALKYLAVFGTPLYLIMFALAREIVLFFFGPTWLPCVIPLRILSLFAYLKFMDTSLFSQLLIAKGNINKLLTINMLLLIINAIAVLWGISYGIVGVALFLFFAGLLSFVINIVLMHPLLNRNWYEYSKTIMPAILSVAIMLPFLLLLRTLPYRGTLFLLPKIMLILTIYAMLLKLWKIDIVREIKLIHKTIKS